MTDSKKWFEKICRDNEFGLYIFTTDEGGYFRIWKFCKNNPKRKRDSQVSYMNPLSKLL